MDFMAEVDIEISKILQTRSQNTTVNEKYCDAKSLKPCLTQLIQELDYLDVNCVKDPDLDTKKGLRTCLIQLVNSSHNLVKLQQETQKKYEKNCDKNVSEQSELIYLRKITEQLRKDLKTKEGLIKLQNERTVMDRIQLDEVTTKLSNAKKEISQLKKDFVKHLPKKVEKTDMKLLQQQNYELLAEIAELRHQT